MIKPEYVQAIYVTANTLVQKKESAATNSLRGCLSNLKMMFPHVANLGSQSDSEASVKKLSDLLGIAGVYDLTVEEMKIIKMMQRMIR